MKLRPLSRDDAREIDRRCEKAGLSTLVLMENAGRGAADLLRREIGPNGRVVIVCGAGNNGGDGAVVARHLDAAGYSTVALWHVIVSERSWSGGLALMQHDLLAEQSRVVMKYSGSEDEDLALLAEADWIVDGLLGTGLNRPVEGFAREGIVAMNRSGKPILSLDIPSGLDADTGEPLGVAVHATITATFVAPKLGFASEEAADYLGRVEVVEIGAPRKILEPFADSD